MATILRNYSETSMISIPADKNNKAIILDVGGKKHKIRGEMDVSLIICSEKLMKSLLLLVYRCIYCDLLKILVL